MTRTTARRAGVLLAALAITVAGCSSSSDKGGATKYNAALTSVVNPSDAKGGTLRMGTVYPCLNWDPATTYGGTCWNLHRFLSRGLTAYAGGGNPDDPGATSRVVGDLATGLGKASADKKTWTYTLRAGVTWRTGVPITSADIKYAFERQFATDVITGGPAGYWLCLLDTCDAKGTPQYKGPYKDPDGGLDSIRTPDARTVVFTLNKPFGDWNELMTLPAASAVHKAYDKASRYGAGTNLVSSGPYYLASSNPKQEVVLKRNKAWSAKTDPIRKALPDVVDVRILSNADDLDERVLNGSLGLNFDGGVATTAQSKIVSDPRLKARADNPVGGGGYILMLYPSDPALKDVHCRRAVAYALNKRDILVQAGGTYGATYATTLIPPDIPGHDKTANLYPSGKNWTGDVAKAKSELQQCGRPTGFRTVMGYSNYGGQTQMFSAMQDSLKRAGITLDGRKLDSTNDYQTLSTPSAVRKQRIGIGIQRWAPDYRSANGYLTLLVDGARYTGTSSSSNFVGLNDPKINALVQRALQVSQSEKVAIYRQVDRLTMQSATYLPLVFAKALLYRSAKVTNFDLTGNAPAYDPANLGLTGAG